ncbi:Transposase [Mycetohabitans rhizoxinica HKI 454]|uniref:Transposase n=1 Tax=Mycetohabitans rhizoxinica (strain DSM 19002 / CIP 109453 / HKI 454) TaxID=882378 RepID=E5ASF8_MYCRK|nr:Transposase [Mycetohabitans rhizoxinica HKI 454]
MPELGSSMTTFYKWRSKYSGMDVPLIAALSGLTRSSPVNMQIASRNTPIALFRLIWLASATFITNYGMH